MTVAWPLAFLGQAPTGAMTTPGAISPLIRAPSCQEPVLPEAQYQQALAVLRNARNALERTPPMTANLDEEKIRDLLLVLPNARFEGFAA